MLSAIGSGGCQEALAARFVAAMQRLGPWEAPPRLAVAVSGGADSLALSVLARDWATDRGGTVLALVVDHGLRLESETEAALTVARLAAQHIPARRLGLRDLRRGSAMAERARDARYQALFAACAAEGLLHLLLGHHGEDQAETLMIRVLGGSQSRGLAAMAALVETDRVRVLRPLLTIPPACLRRMLTARGLAWVEDPSNRDRHALRARLRLLRAEPGDPATDELLAAADVAARARAAEDRVIAEELAARATIRPEGFAILSPGPLSAAAFAALVQAIGGHAYPGRSERLAALARAPRPATVAGIRLVPAGRLGDGLLVVREYAAIGAPVSAVQGAVWDGRFRIVRGEGLTNSMVVDALGDDAARFRKVSGLPASVLRTLPAIRAMERHDGIPRTGAANFLVEVPHLSYPAVAQGDFSRLVFSPPRPAAGAPFLSARDVCHDVSAGLTDGWGCGTGDDTLC